ncbi:pilus assembly protein PilP [Inmirania thermothiophila]|uniref:Type IV pilus assembly protein PilP n=1 Tax=Inmirania thermothiophila TaxID=1750597 RepID=A0A3N1Y940_9GAMM|nr:pilus assembly protein PilP [Inmirania thermothiophila]ROR34122.1 type IV pilus assembly protein PilP [Inmirania thermothiophila]
MSRRVAGVLAAAAVLAAGCAPRADVADLERYVAEVRARPGGRIEPLPEVRPYETFAYRPEGLRDPFEPTVSRREPPAQVQASAGGGLQPDFNRPRELLEQYPLDALRMVGTLEQGGRTWALVRAPDGTLHRVTVGNHLGQNFGEIVEVSEERVQVREIVPDGLGGWQERMAALSLLTE